MMNDNVEQLIYKNKVTTQVVLWEFEERESCEQKRSQIPQNKLIFIIIYCHDNYQLI